MDKILFKAYLRILIKKYYKPSLSQSGKISLLDIDAIIQDYRVNTNRDGEDTYTPYYIPMIIAFNRDYAYSLDSYITNELKLKISDDMSFKELFILVEQHYWNMGAVKGSLLTKFSQYAVDMIIKKELKELT